MKMTLCIVLGFAALVLCGTVAGATDKTLVSWVALANTTQQGGSVLTIQCDDRFDAIVFGERASGKWMAGSDSFRRRKRELRASSAPTVGKERTQRISFPGSLIAPTVIASTASRQHAGSTATTAIGARSATRGTSRL